MNRVVRARAAIAILDLLVIVAIVGVGWVTFRGQAPSPEIVPPAAFDVLSYAVPEVQTRGAGLGRVEVVWTELDLPLPPPPVAVTTPPPAAPAPQGRLIMVSVHSSEPARSGGIVEDSLGNQAAVFVGDAWHDAIVARVEIRERAEGGIVSELTLLRGESEQVLALIRD